MAENRALSAFARRSDETYLTYEAQRRGLEVVMGQATDAASLA